MVCLWCSTVGQCQLEFDANRAKTRTWPAVEHEEKASGIEKSTPYEIRQTAAKSDSTSQGPRRASRHEQLAETPLLAIWSLAGLVARTLEPVGQGTDYVRDRVERDACVATTAARQGAFQRWENEITKLCQLVGLQT